MISKGDGERRGIRCAAERRREGGRRKETAGELPQMFNIYIYWVLTKKVAKKIRLYVAQEI